VEKEEVELQPERRCIRDPHRRPPTVAEGGQARLPPLRCPAAPPAPPATENARARFPPHRAAKRARL